MYTQHFALHAEPFGMTPDPAFLYLSPGHREALAAIHYGLLDRRGFITLVGEVGTGKTTLLYKLLGTLGDEVDSAYVAYTAQEFEEIVAAALRDLGVETTGSSKAALLAALNAHLLRRAEEGRAVALIIDEAQTLNDRTFEELRLLSNFETYTRKLLQIVLVGQPELRDRLSRPELRQLGERASVCAVVNPLSPSEMRRYIEHRLRLAGGAAARLFSRHALGRIVRRADGIPRRANILCHNALLFAYGRGMSHVTAAIAREAIAEMDGSRLRRPAARISTWARWGIGAASALVLAAMAEPAFERSTRSVAAIGTPPVAVASSSSASETLALTVPPGATLTDLVRGVYGRKAKPSPALMQEIRRLNPQLANPDRIVAGAALRFPLPGSLADGAARSPR